MSTVLSELSPELSLGEDDFEIIRRVGAVRRYAPGEVVFHLGVLGSEMFLILTGEVELIFEGGKSSKKLHRGAFFGELAFIMGAHRRTATVRAAGACELAVIDESTINQLTQSHPVLLFQILRRSTIYLFRSEQTLIADLKQKNLQLRQNLDFLRVTREELDYQELLAQTDQLTGLYNRRCLDDQLQKFIDRQDSADAELGLLMLDLDGFKPINDTYGHQAGDEVLVKIGHILKQSSRKTDLACRIGGDEFAILLTDIHKGRGAEVGERVRVAIAALPPVEQGSDKRVTGSLGGTLYELNEAPASFMDRADRYLYQAKHQGRNCVVWKDTE